MIVSAGPSDGPLRVVTLLGGSPGSSVVAFRMNLAENQKWIFVSLSSTGGAPDVYFIKSNWTDVYLSNVGGLLQATKDVFIWTVAIDYYDHLYVIKDPATNLYWTADSADMTSPVPSAITLTAPPSEAQAPSQLFGIGSI